MLLYTHRAFASKAEQSGQRHASLDGFVVPHRNDYCSSVNFKL